MPVVSAGILIFSLQRSEPEVFLVHPGGPFFAKKDEGWWTIPKGEVLAGEEYEQAALRECREELGVTLNAGGTSLGSIKQKGGKVVHAWAVEANAQLTSLLSTAVFAELSNTFEVEWPPRSDKRQSFPEIDRGSFFSLAVARQKILPAQIPFLDRLVGLLSEKRQGEEGFATKLTEL